MDMSTLIAEDLLLLLLDDNKGLLTHGETGCRRRPSHHDSHDRGSRRRGEQRRRLNQIGSARLCAGGLQARGRQDP